MSWQTPKTNWASTDGVTNTDLNRVEENTRVLSQQSGAYGAAAGTANAYTVTTNPPITALVEGMSVATKINIANTGASTINVNGLGAITIKKSGATDLGSGDLVAGAIYELVYDGTYFQLISGGGGSSSYNPLTSPSAWIN